MCDNRAVAPPAPPAPPRFARSAAGASAIVVACGLFFAPLRTEVTALLLCLAGLWIGAAVLGRHPLPPGALLVLLVVTRVFAFAAPPVLSDDHFRYVHEARATRLGLHVPYAVAPQDLVPPPPPDDGSSARVNHPDIPAAYPPFSQLALWAFIGLGDWLGHALSGLKLLALLCDGLLLVWLWTRRGPAAAQRYGLHPLVLLEAPLGAHLDVVGAVLVTGAVLVAGRPVVRGLLTGLAIGVKPIAALALLGQRLAPRPLLLAGGAMVCAAVGSAVPHLAAAAPLGGGLLEYGTRWEAHPTVYRAVNAVVHPPFAARHKNGVYTHLHVDGGGVLLEQSAQPLAAWGTPGPAARRVLVDDRLIARGLCAGLFLWWLVWLLPFPPLERAMWALWAVFLFLPTFHPWYGLWALPLAAAAGARGVLGAAALLPAFYLVDHHGWPVPVEWAVLAVSAVAFGRAWTGYRAGATRTGRPAHTD